VKNFKELGFKVQSHPLTHFHDDYGIQAGENEEDDQDEDEDMDDDDDDDDDDDEDSDSDESMSDTH
jgi:hypothetical protein